MGQGGGQIGIEWAMSGAVRKEEVRDVEVCRRMERFENKSDDLEIYPL